MLIFGNLNNTEVLLILIIVLKCIANVILYDQHYVLYQCVFHNHTYKYLMYVLTSLLVKIQLPKVTDELARSNVQLFVYWKLLNGYFG